MRRLAVECALVAALFGLTAILTGCAAHRNRVPKPVQEYYNGVCWVRCFNYPRLDLAVCVTCRETVQLECDGATRYDDGRPRQKGDPIGACHDGSTNTIWLERPEDWVHEACHADGTFSRRTCGRYFQWPKEAP